MSTLDSYLVSRFGHVSEGRALAGVLPGIAVACGQAIRRGSAMLTAA